MIKFRTLQHRFVDDIPESLDPGILYVSVRYATVMHLCCCGCGREVVTPLSPAQWKMTFDGEAISLYPSIGNWNVSCRSHYIIQKNHVIEAQSWSDDEVMSGQEYDRRARNAYYGAKALPQIDTLPSPSNAPKARKSWLSLVGDFFAGKQSR